MSMNKKINSNFLFDCSYDTPLGLSVIFAYNKLIKTISTISIELCESKYIEGTGGIVSVRDLVAYQIGWGKLVIYWYNAGKLKRVPDMPGEGFTAWDYVGLAKHFYVKYHLKSLIEQLQEFYQIVAEILSIIELESSEGNLDKVGVWSWCTLKSGKHWPLSKWIQVNTISPYKRASKLINNLTNFPIN
ncbi:MAG: ClbS/DfsB family four-helix bundle protein [Parachlamydiaceae bacterium]|nr:ClbS/DfsB family four-helix bundle protein [Parachlamydiaceae bacterium]